ncbi:amidohydrolase family protein [Paenibacillus cremeus]|uniref:Amidohydrolase family protein n=2 Tax=Paenibacillus cremeus TaxID=2163881 RepID=A0A559K573_9BACL|nr:amidohydrolase family protein [Paenibacillus cremeus]
MVNTFELHLINAALPLLEEKKLFELKAAGGRWISIRKQEQPGELQEQQGGPIATLSTLSDGRDLSGCRIDLEGRMLLPGLVDAHMHLDKAYSLSAAPNQSGTLYEAIHSYSRVAPMFTKEQIKARMRKAALRALSFGTTAIRSHIDFHLRTGAEVAMRTVQAALELKEELSGQVALEFFPMCPYNSHTLLEQDAIHEALQLGLDGLGGAPHLSETPERDIDRIFELAARYGKPIDLHADESDDPTKRTAAYIAEKTIAYGFQGCVTVDHLCSLSAMDEEAAASVIRSMADAKLQAVTLPACNLYLQGRGDRGLIRRGTTRIKELLEAGIPLATASDNIQDPFHPFGRGDLAQIGQLTAYAAHMGSPQELRTLLRMMTDIPASILGLKEYGIAEGHPVNFVIMDALTVDEWFAEQPAGRWVYNNRRWLSVTRTEHHMGWVSDPEQHATQASGVQNKK